MKEIGSLKNYDIVISDNLLEVLELRPDAWILGSFFCHKAIKDVSCQLFDNSEKLLKYYKPKVISSEIFGADYLKNNTKLYKVGLFVDNQSFEIKKLNKKDLLISFGYGGDLTEKFNELIFSIKDPFPFETIFIEPILYNKKLPSFFKPADFSNEMYSGLMCAIIRPGIGTVTKCLFFKSRIFAISETNNYEISFNAKQIS